MERIKTTTTSYHADGTSNTTSTVTVRELDEGEVDILMAGNNSIFDSSLTPHMLKTVDYHISDTDCAESEHEDLFASVYSDDEGNDHWFPSLSKAFCIEEMDNSDDEADKALVETLYATNVVEVDDIPMTTKTSSRRPSKSRKISSWPSRTDDHVVNLVSDNDSDNSLGKMNTVVPLDVVYTLLND